MTRDTFDPVKYVQIMDKFYELMFIMDDKEFTSLSVKYIDLGASILGAEYDKSLPVRSQIAKKFKL